MLATTPLLGVMEIDATFTVWDDFGHLTLTWLQDAGGFAAVGLLLWVIYVLMSPSPTVSGGRRKMISKFMAVTGIMSLIVYLIALGLTIAIRIDDQQIAEQQGAVQQQNPQQPKPQRVPTMLDVWQLRTLTVGGLLALIAFAEPCLLDLSRLRTRRLFAIAKLSFKEAVRRRIVWIFFIFLLIFLFPATWFFFKRVKDEDVLKTTISVISYLMTILLIFTALLLSAFSIPSDVKNQTIHTVLTKPVERFEVVFGRFLGYTALMTIALLALSAVSLIFVASSNINEAARKESMKARVPVYGYLDFIRERVEGNQIQTKAFIGMDVGREYSYRKYIAGSSESTQRAVWSFVNVSDLSNLRDMPAVPLEFAFDVFRMTKGEENRGVLCSFDLVTWKWDQANQEEYTKAVQESKYRKDKDGKKSPASLEEEWENLNGVAEKFGRYENKSFPVFDYHTYKINIPPGILRNALDGTPGKDYLLQSPSGPVRLQVKVKCESPSQFIGVAPLDLYFLEAEGSFWLNFFKGAIGLWCRLCIVIALAVAASTYLAGVVSFLLALSLFLAGYFQSFIKSLAEGANVGGGPLESLTRLVKGSVTAADLDKTATVQAALFGDDLFRWLLRRFLNVIPDTERFTWSNYIAQGFNIGWEFILMNMIFLVGYLLPWALLSYYLMRSREIAA
ncbi:MAG: ABC transporter permease [Planctomycetes bacterium]|nr:ABC transporter permease [Planctomycetota bacterium]